MEYIQAKSILSKVKNAPDSWFGLTYNMNLYRGCQHQCIYCDSRSECYRINDFSKIQVKQNAISLLEKEIKSKRLKGTIGTGSMNDPYMPIENELRVTRQALGIIQKYKFPVHVLTKSDLVLRDIDLLQQINQTYAAISFSITSYDDDLSKKIEPAASLSSARFSAMEKLAMAGIYTGMLLMPILPYINDTLENIKQLVNMAADHGAKYIVSSLGVTLRDRQRDYYFDKLDKYFPEIKGKYMLQFGDAYGCMPENYKALNDCLKNECAKLGLATKMDIFQLNNPEQLSLF
jgi:DNA repair photolyase